jgi:hypothetical protein
LGTKNRKIRIEVGMSEEKKSENIMQSSLQVAEAILEKAPIYEDLAQPTAKAIGAGFGGVLLHMMAPFIKMGISAKQDIQDFQSSLERKTESIPQERLQSPNLTVAGPIIQALGYTVHEEPLREMFTNLLATAMDSETATKAHPAFAEIIKQISPDEAKILVFITEKHVLPIIDVQKTLIDGGYQVIFSNQSFIPEESGCEHTNLGPSYLENLCRLAIMEIQKGAVLAPESYNKLESWFGDFEESKETHVNGKKVFTIKKKIIGLTEFGKQFVSACVRP